MEHRNKTCVITGASSGIGYETAKALIIRGWNVFLLCRNFEKGNAARERLLSFGAGKPCLSVCDLTLMRSVREAAQEILHRGEKIDVIINNAGCLTQGQKKSAEGWEYSFAVNFLGPFELTRSLLAENPPERVVNLSSAAIAGVSVDPNTLNDLSGYQAYAASKLANALFCIELAKRYEGQLLAMSADPGAAGTGFGGNLSFPMSIAMSLVRPFLPSPADAARTSIFLATERKDKLHSGRLYHRKNQPTDWPFPNEISAQSPLIWDAAEKLLTKTNP